MFSEYVSMFVLGSLASKRREKKGHIYYVCVVMRGLCCRVFLHLNLRVRMFLCMYICSCLCYAKFLPTAKPDLGASSGSIHVTLSLSLSLSSGVSPGDRQLILHLMQLLFLLSRWASWFGCWELRFD